jgi:DNA polymerase III subunit delta
MHATEFARQSGKAAQAALVVLYGSERHLVSSVVGTLCREVLGAPVEEAHGLLRFAGKDADFRTIHDELQMVSMFSSRKLVVVEEADEFVTRFRPQLENYVEKPSRKSLLVLDVKTWRSNTRLAKKVAECGLAVECSELTGAKLTGWLTAQAKQQHEKQLTREAAQLMTELAGTGLGLLDQELGKLAAYVGDRKRIDVEDVRKLVGGWKAETTWTMIDAVRDGRVDVALACLHKLLYAGEAPQKILGGMNYVFRKFAEATERSRTGQPLRVALKESGVFPRDIDEAEKYLRRIGRPRAEQILERLARTDYGMKGGSRMPERLQMERLLLALAGAE